jgi:hypothetical protein
MSEYQSTSRWWPGLAASLLAEEVFESLDVFAQECECLGEGLGAVGSAGAQ